MRGITRYIGQILFSLQNSVILLSFTIVRIPLLYLFYVTQLLINRYLYNTFE